MRNGEGAGPILADVEKETTTIVVPKPLRERIKTFRRHPRETVADILAYIMDCAEGKV